MTPPTATRETPTQPTADTPLNDVPHVPGEPALRLCVGDVSAFVAEHFGRRPLLRRAGDDGASVLALLSVDDVDHLLTSTALRLPALRLIQGGDALPPTRYTRSARMGSRTVTDMVDPGKALECFRGGATVVLQGLQRYWPPLTRFCRELELALTHPVQANAYLTPPGSQGLRVHHDMHDVFALQTHGRKHWVVYEPVVEAPVAGQTWTPERIDDLGDPTFDVVMHPADVLYLPRGTPHAARTVEEASLHVTIGIRSATWLDLLHRAVDVAAGQQAVRASLPAGYANDPARLGGEFRRRLAALADLVRNLDAEEVLEAEAGHFWGARRPQLDGQLRNLLELDEIRDETRVCRRSGATGRIRTEADRVILVLGDRSLRLPVAAEKALRFVVEHDRFTVGELAAHLDAAGRLVLVRRLVREGLLVIDRG
jgi:bifunctional lysine-specific demethylase and histidyl-hydroxylase NO66